MMMLTTYALIASVVLLAVSVFYNIKFARIILAFEDRVEDALDDLDKRYSVMSEILARPIFFDSIEVRRVVAEITETRSTILRIANGLARLEASDEREAR
jgi:hypothetical protein